MKSALIAITTFACVLPGVATAQTAGRCEALLLQQDIEAYAENEQLNYHFHNAVDEETYRSLQRGADGAYGAISGSYEEFSERRNVLRSRASTNYTREDSRALLRMRTPREAITAYSNCVAQTSSAGYLDSVVIGEPDGTDFTVVLIWKPEQRDGTAPLQISGSDGLDGLPASLDFGESAYAIHRPAADQEIHGSVRGTAGGRAYSTVFRVPRWQPVTIRNQFPIRLASLTPDSCTGRASNCIQNGEVITPPPLNGIGRATFSIPSGARRFEAVLTSYDPRCISRGNWRGEIYVDDVLLFRKDMGDVASAPLNVFMPEGARLLELRSIDINNHNECDDTQWSGALFRDH